MKRSNVKLRKQLLFSTLFLVLSAVGVIMIIASNLTTPLLPDTYDPTRPQDTWGCCMTPLITAHPWRWPLFLIGSGLLMINATWGVFYLHRELRRLMKQSPNKNTVVGSPRRAIEMAMVLIPIIITLMVLVSIGAGVASSTTLLSLKIVRVLSNIAWITTLAYGCLLLPFYIAATIARWRTKQLNIALAAQKQRTVAILQTITLVTFIPLVWLITYSFIPSSHAATSHGRYPLDILTRPLSSTWGETIPLIIVWGLFIALAIITAIVQLFVNSHSHKAKPSGTKTPAPTDTPS